MATLPILAQLAPLEKVSHYTPLGIRFWDPAAGRVVKDGLEVVARPLASRGPVRRAFQTLSGIYAFRALPGLRTVETPDPELPPGERLLEMSPSVPARFVIEVRDRLGRFLAHTFQVNVPVRGIYPTPMTASPPAAALPGAFLFSDPSRPALSGTAVIRSQIVERLGVSQFRPASFAVVRVQAGNGLGWLGIADETGALAVHFPYPPFDAVFNQNSPPAMPPERRAQSWEMTAQVHYRPNTQTRADAFATLPDLGALLTQPQAQLFPTPGGPVQSSTTFRLEFGRPFLLQTAGNAELWVTP